jgi:four helix bundle protein
MVKINKFEEIESWKAARELTNFVYKTSSSGPFSKDFALRDQIRRSTISIMSNIAEGFERGGDKEFLQFLSIAKGSCGEARSQLYIALDQSYLSQAEFNSAEQKVTEASRLISGLMKYLQQSEMRGSKFE